MAEENKKDAKKTESKKGDNKNLKLNIIVWSIAGVCVIAASAGGFALAQIFAASSPLENETIEQEVKRANVKTFDEIVTEMEKAEEPWQYELEPVVANLDEPGVTRFLRITVIMEMSGKMEPVKGREFLDVKKSILRDWLTTFTAGLSLEDVRGSRNLSTIKLEIRENFNRLLFKESEPFVENILLKEFAVQ